MKYAVMSFDGEIDTIITTVEQIDPESIGKDSQGRSLLLPVKTQTIKTVDTELFTVSSPKYQVGQYEVVEHFDIDPVPDFEGILLRRIDERAEMERSRIVSAYPTMNIVYSEKLKEAQDYLGKEYRSGSNPAPSGKYLLLEAGVGSDGDNLDEVAMVVVTASKAFVIKAALIEKNRLWIKSKIRSAATLDKKKLAFDDFKWDLELDMDRSAV